MKFTVQRHRLPKRLRPNHRTLVHFPFTHNSAPHYQRFCSQQFLLPSTSCPASLVALTVKNLSAMWETWVWCLGRKDPLEEEMSTYSSILARKTPWTEEHGIAESDMTERLTLSLSCAAVKKKGTSKGNKALFEETQQASDPDMTDIGIIRLEI